MRSWYSDGIQTRYQNNIKLLLLTMYFEHKALLIIYFLFILFYFYYFIWKFDLLKILLFLDLFVKFNTKHEQHEQIIRNLSIKMNVSCSDNFKCYSSVTSFGECLAT